MSITQRDLMSRMIQQLAEIFGRIVNLRRANRLDEAMLLVNQTAVKLFGPIWPTLERLDSQSAAALLGGREKVSAYAMLAQHRAEIDELRGEWRKARAGFVRALELHLESARLGAEVDVPTRSSIRTLRPRVDPERLSRAYRVILEHIDGPERLQRH
jgi:hypothetical protein